MGRVNELEELKRRFTSLSQKNKFSLSSHVNTKIHFSHKTRLICNITWMESNLISNIISWNGSSSFPLSIFLRTPEFFQTFIFASKMEHFWNHQPINMNKALNKVYCFKIYKNRWLIKFVDSLILTFVFLLFLFQHLGCNSKGWCQTCKVTEKRERESVYERDRESVGVCEI